MMVAMTTPPTIRPIMAPLLELTSSAKNTWMDKRPINHLPRYIISTDTWETGFLKEKFYIIPLLDIYEGQAWMREYRM